MTAQRKHQRRYPGPGATFVPIWYACEVWACSRALIYTWRVRGLLPAEAFLGSGRGTRIRRDVIESTPVARSA